VSKRLQMRMPDDEHHSVAEEQQVAPEERIAAVLRFARFIGPTGDIDQLLSEIERGRTSE